MTTTNNLEKYMNNPDLLNEPMPMREVHAIRLKIYDETKHMNTEERMAYIHNKAETVMKQYGLMHLTID